jgi:hypothetical protein
MFFFSTQHNLLAPVILISKQVIYMTTEQNEETCYQWDHAQQQLRSRLHSTPSITCFEINAHDDKDAEVYIHLDPQTVLGPFDSVFFDATDPTRALTVNFHENFTVEGLTLNGLALRLTTSPTMPLAFWHEGTLYTDWIIRMTR